jgi:hypothetical protein
MAFLRASLTTSILGALLLALTSCSEDPTLPVENQSPPAPKVVVTYPTPEQTNIGPTSLFRVVFDTPMDPATAAGAVLLSSGEVTALEWTDPRTLTIEHTALERGERITLTLGTSLMSADGAALAAPATLSFWIDARPGFVLHGSIPAAGTTAAPRDQGIILLFSRTVSPSSTEEHGTIHTGPGGTTLHPFSASQFRINGGHAVVMTPEPALPPGAEITVTLKRGLRRVSGTDSLSVDVSFTFVTGEDRDVTPPVVMAVDPPNEATAVAVTKGYIRLAFSEPVLIDSAEPVLMNLAFKHQLTEAQSRPVWNADHTEVTYLLPHPVPAGLPVEIHLAGVRDRAGNTMATDYRYRFQFAGEADYYPLSDGSHFSHEIQAERFIEADGITYHYSRVFEQVTEEQPDGSFREAEYTSEYGDLILEGGRTVRRAPGGVEWLDFTEISLPWAAKNTFAEPLLLLPLPLVAGATWVDSTRYHDQAREEYRAVLSGRVLGRSDVLPLSYTDATIVRNVWTVERNLVVHRWAEEQWTPAWSRRDSLVYAPTLGEFRAWTEIDHAMQGYAEQSSSYRFPVPSWYEWW